MTRSLRVHHHDVPIGELLDRGHHAEFRFYESYWALNPRPVLGLWFEGGARDEVYVGPGTLPAFFDNLEPEGALARALSRAHGLGAGVLELLSAGGRDLPGALRLDPEASAEASARQVILPDGVRPLAFSLAGVQLKYSMSIDKQDRITIPSPGEMAEWILKVPPLERFRGLAQNEAATMAWARRAGFLVPECRVVGPEEVEGVDGLPMLPLLLVKRFDRGGQRTHHEDLAQAFWLRPGQKALPPDGDDLRPDSSGERQKHAATTEGLARFAMRNLGKTGFEEFLRRLVFLIASGNGDAHLKNWSIWYPDRLRPTWAPLYDQVSTVAWSSDTLILPLQGNRACSAIHQTQLTRLATDVGFPAGEASDIIDQTLTVIRDAWPGEPEYSGHHAGVLRARWKKLPLTRGRPHLT